MGTVSVGHLVLEAQNSTSLCFPEFESSYAAELHSPSNLTPCHSSWKRLHDQVFIHFCMYVCSELSLQRV